MSDFYSDSAQKRLAMIEAERAAALADLAAFRSQSDYESAGNAIQQVANLDAERANLAQLYNNYVASQTPPAPEQLTQEERNARPWHKMTPDDALQLARTSKYGRDLDWNNPHVRAGWAESQRRKSRGE
jgi:hypothetical protein